VQSLLTELNVPFATPKVLCDNLSTVSLAHNHVLHARSKHMELDLFFVREKVLQKQLLVSHVPGQFQVADIMTKALPPTRFEALRSKLTVCSSTPNEACGGVLKDSSTTTHNDYCIP